MAAVQSSRSSKQRIAVPRVAEALLKVAESNDGQSNERQR